ncbi:uncharacterized protein LOC118198254 [Stegodyphus dumicola]|uniref:uncharacterized protein LOC118198254 n=1 Tax=Stegodyphus dumicola TaxID=202533 RepID=UPI0015A88963|nr:uncharacterized protein LOC118198254 [Stegodyphus dumicola]
MEPSGNYVGWGFGFGWHRLMMLDNPSLGIDCISSKRNHGQINYGNFKKWVLEKLLPNLRPQSVVCMDIAPYHTKIEDPTPTKYATKQTMNGHHVLRLPPYHCDLNAIEYVWSSVKGLIRKRNVTGDLSLENLKNLTQKALDEVTSQEWQAHCNYIEKLENSYWDKDENLEEIVYELIIQTGSSDSDSDSEETESCDSDSDDFSDVNTSIKVLQKASFFFI